MTQGVIHKNDPNTFLCYVHNKIRCIKGLLCFSITLTNSSLSNGNKLTTNRYILSLFLNIFKTLLRQLGEFKIIFPPVTWPYYGTLWQPTQRQVADSTGSYLAEDLVEVALVSGVGDTDEDGEEEKGEHGLPDVNNVLEDKIVE